MSFRRNAKNPRGADRSGAFPRKSGGVDIIGALYPWRLRLYGGDPRNPPLHDDGNLELPPYPRAFAHRRSMTTRDVRSPDYRESIGYNVGEVALPISGKYGRHGIRISFRAPMNTKDAPDFESFTGPRSALMSGALRHLLPNLPSNGPYALNNHSRPSSQSSNPNSKSPRGSTSFRRTDNPPADAQTVRDYDAFGRNYTYPRDPAHQKISPLNSANRDVMAEQPDP